MKIPFIEALKFLEGADLYMVNHEITRMVTIDYGINPPYLAIESNENYAYISMPLEEVEISDSEVHLRDNHGTEYVVTAYNKRYTA